MAEDLKFRVTADNKADAALKGVKKKVGEVKKGAQDTTTAFGKFSSALGKIGGAVAGIAVVSAAFKKIGDSISEALDVAGEYETRFKTLEGVLEATGYAAGLTADEIRTMAQEIALGTLESTEGVERAAMKLASFKDVGKDSFRTVLEYGADLAALGFGNLQSNVQKLGQALEDPVQGINRLRRAGVSFTDKQKEMIKSLVETGQKAEAQAIILAQVADRVKGAGAAAAQGLQGAWDTFGQRVEELNNEVGQLFSDMSIAVAKMGTAMAEWAAAQVQALAEVGEAWASLGRSVTEHVGGIVNSLREVVNEALGIEDITQVGAAIDSTFVKATQALNPFSAALKAIGPVGEQLADIFMSSGERQRQAISQVNDELKKQSAALGQVGSEIDKIGGSIKAQFDAVKSALSDATSEIDRLGEEIFNLNSSAEDFLLEMQGVDDVTRAWEEYKRVVEEIARVQDELANAEQDDDTDRQIELKKELLDLNKQAAEAAKESGRDDTAVRHAAERVELTKDLVGQLEEERSAQEEIAAQMRENLQAMQEMLDAADGVAERLGMLKDEGGIDLGIDMDAFEEKIGQVEERIAQERQLQVGWDQLDALRKELEDMDGLELGASLEIQSNIDEIVKQREAIKEDTKSKHRVDADTAQANAAIRELERTTYSDHYVRVHERQAATGGLIGLATGGYPRKRGRVHGPGTSTSDSIPAMLSAGEYVIRASSVRKYGAAFLDKLNRGLLSDLPRFAAGGPIQPRDINGSDSGDLPEMAVNLSVQGGQQMRLTSSRATARELADALRTLERAR